VTTAEKYVTAAYVVVLAVALLYVVLYAFKIARLERQVSELAERRREAEARGVPEPPQRARPARVARQ
jgi:hypothetical protein